MTVKEICENLGLGSVSDSSVPPTKTYCEKESEAFSRKLATRGNTPWKKAAHIILKDDKLIKTFLLEQWKVLTGNGKHSQSLYLPVKDKDGVYEKYDAWGDLVGTGQLEELLQLTAVDLEGVPAGAFAREGFNVLVQKGFLTETVSDDGKSFKVLTNTSASVGISSIKKESAYGRIYDVNVYNRDGQKYILEHINEITHQQGEIL